MASSTLFNTSTPTLGEVFANGKSYIVPRYQRDYSWEEEQWDELWSDIVSADSNKVDHYMGSIVLQDTGDRKRFTIIDGQQRLVTLSLLAIAVVRYLSDLIAAGIDAAKNSERVRLTRERFLSARDAASLLEVARLKLNRNNDPLYTGTLVQLNVPVAPRRLGASDKLLWEALRFFSEKLKSKFGEKSDGEKVSALLNTSVADRLVFIQIVVDDELGAYTVFETLNARGTRLTVTDLLKNYLFSQFRLSETDLDQIELQWGRIVGLTEMREFPTFLRYHWISRYEMIRQQELFRAIKRKVLDGQQSLALLTDLEDTAYLFFALQRPSDELWAGNRGLRRRVRELSLFGVTQCYPLLFAAFSKMKPEANFEDVLRICSVLSFRYVVVGKLNTQPMERAYGRAALKVFSGAITTPKQVFEEIGELYVPDENFKAQFANLIVETKGKKDLVRYVLFEIENHIAGTNHSFDDNPATVEHIFPESPTDQWREHYPDGEQNVYRLGNYTLLEERKNRDCGNKTFAEKKAIYATSQFELARRITADEWNSVALTARQNFLANQAVTAWKLSYQ